ncbi:MAG: response regulator [Acidobacteria bacterium]|nr:response regulator [Acidobacteriota bacterium]
MQKEIRILLLEDDPLDAELILRQLQSPGIPFTWRRAGDKGEYLRELQDFVPDIILSDNSLPGFDGLSALNIAREQCPEAMFIFVSGTIGEERAIESLKRGATDYVLKDSLTRLVPAIRRALKESEERSERNRAEQALRSAESKFRTLVEQSLVGIYIIQERKFVYVNPRFADAFGYPPSEITEMSSILDLLIEQDVEAVLAHVRKLEEGRIDALHLTFRGKTKDGTLLYLEAHGAMTEYNERPAIIGTLLDVTERVRTEEALRASEEQLRQAQKMEAVGRLAGGIAHDFNNLLTAITGYSEILLDRVGAESSLRREIEEIQRAGERAAALTRQLLTFSRKRLLQPVVLDLNSTVNDVEKMLARVIGEDIQLTTDLAAEPGIVRADPTQLEQVILNLAVNARDAMPQGGRLTIRTVPVEIGPSQASLLRIDAPPGPYMMLVVTDTGFGMDPETQSRIFEPFFTTKEHGKGTGLGLSMVYGIVQQSGGHIRVQSEPGRGTSFEIYLPRLQESADRLDVQGERRLPPSGTETILLVEDDDTVRSLIYEVLHGCGYKVLVSASGDLALNICQGYKGRIDLVISDVVMPGVGGPELVGRISLLRPNAKVLYVSGYTEEAMLHRGVLDSGFALLQKPFTPEKLARRVREVLDG